MRLSVPAKINLHLRVGPPAGDGFHPLLSWMCTVGLFDTLILHPSATPGISLTCDHPDVPCDQGNLVVRCATLLSDSLRARGGTPTGVAAELHKRIPAGAGLGGGSADGAFTLRALNALWQAGHSRQELSALAAQAGSDLSFFLFGPSSVCTGRGEIVRPIAPPRPRAAILILPAIKMPTPAVYRKFDQLAAVSPWANDRLTGQPSWELWVQLKAAELMEYLINDLEGAAFAIRPDLGDLRASVERGIGQRVRMSGSGSSLFSLFDEAEEAEAAATRIAAAHNVAVHAVALAPVWWKI